MSDAAPEKKSPIIVDEDWKTRVQAEKEQAQQQREQKERGATEPQGHLPPANFHSLVEMLATQALLGLGQFATPKDGKVMVDLELARHSIDLLTMLQEKTRGNLAGDELVLLNNALYDLRAAFVSIQNRIAQQPPQPPPQP
jgi:flagellar motor switch/type III secretory pathway protein FliN